MTREMRFIAWVMVLVSGVVGFATFGILYIGGQIPGSFFGTPTFHAAACVGAASAGLVLIIMGGALLKDYLEHIDKET